MGIPQAFQHIGVGGIAGLGLFLGRQAELLEQGRRQLLGRIEVEGIADGVVYLPLDVIDAGLQGFPKGGDAGAVRRHPDVLHRGQYLGQGDFHAI